MDAAFGTPYGVILKGNQRNSTRAIKYVDHVADIIKIFANDIGNNVGEKHVNNDAKSVVDFESDLIEVKLAIIYLNRHRYFNIYIFQIVPPNVAKYDAERRHNVFTIGEFQAWYDSHSQSPTSKVVKESNLII